MTRSESIKELAAALAKAQAEMKPAIRDAQNPHLKNRYADLAAVWEACRVPLTSNGLAVLQPASAARNAVTIETTLLHVSGEWIAETLTLEAKDASPQSIGSAITYGRRYGLAAMVGVCPEDDDGEGAMSRAGDHSEPAYQAQRQPQRSNGQAQHEGPPRSGKALFAWTKEMEQKHEVGLLKYLNSWAKLQDYPGRMVDWDAEQVALAHKEAVRKIESIQPSDGEAYEEALGN